MASKPKRGSVGPWKGGELEVVRVTDAGLGLQFREPLGPSHAVPFGDGLALLQPRVVPVTDTKSGELLAEIEIGVVGGKPGVVAIRAQSAPLTSTFLKNLPSLRELVAGVAREATVRLARTPEGEIIGERFVVMPQRPIRDRDDEIVGTAWGGEAPESLGAGLDEVDADLEDVLGARKRRTLDREFLSKVADIYREAQQQGLSTQREIQRQLGPISDAGARRWVKAARDAKPPLLGESLGPWKAGEKG
jgi:hypothetical protein